MFIYVSEGRTAEVANTHMDDVSEVQDNDPKRHETIMHFDGESCLNFKQAASPEQIQNLMIYG